MKLKHLETAAVKLRRELPPWLGPGDVECFIEIEARPAGTVNPAWVAGSDRLRVKAAIEAKKLAAVTDPETYVLTDRANKVQSDADWAGMTHDACIIAWRTNILDDGKPIEPTRANFVALVEAAHPDIGRVMIDLQLELIKAGAAAEAEAREALKN